MRKRTPCFLHPEMLSIIYDGLHLLLLKIQGSEFIHLRSVSELKSHFSSKPVPDQFACSQYV